MTKAKKRVKSIEISKVKSGEKGHGYKVVVHHHDQPPKEGKGMHAAMPSYTPPEEHFHPTHGAMKKHVNELTSNMSVSPDGDGDEQMPDESGPQESALNE